MMPMNDSCREAEHPSVGWQRVVESSVSMFVAAFVSITVLLIFANDRLDGDEVWKGGIVGPAVVGACKFSQSKLAQQLVGDKFSRWLGMKSVSQE